MLSFTCQSASTATDYDTIAIFPAECQNWEGWQRMRTNYFRFWVTCRRSRRFLSTAGIYVKRMKERQVSDFIIFHFPIAIPWNWQICYNNFAVLLIGFPFNFAGENLSKKPLLEDKKRVLLEKVRGNDLLLILVFNKIDLSIDVGIKCSGLLFLQLMQYDKLNELRAEFDHLSQRQDSALHQFDIPVIQDRLKVAAQEAEEESESIADQFLDGEYASLWCCVRRWYWRLIIFSGNLAVDEFIKQYMQKRSVSEEILHFPPSASSFCLPWFFENFPFISDKPSKKSQRGENPDLFVHLKFFTCDHLYICYMYPSRFSLSDSNAVCWWTKLFLHVLFNFLDVFQCGWGLTSMAPFWIIIQSHSWQSDYQNQSDDLTMVFCCAMFKTECMYML